ncbi:hypothetical protein NDN08_002352 [Rhodosorus marinus]|uniref:Uncharacterized protein n=1 Tax=Rhodosorus marinus TaxID=101924 RepID=A0AAV8UXW8_9RHOD|nr:hypothetical protein NDN08_002352 [Rhodosorus marinus]
MKREDGKQYECFCELIQRVSVIRLDLRRNLTLLEYGIGIRMWTSSVDKLKAVRMSCEMAMNLLREAAMFVQLKVSESVSRMDAERIRRVLGNDL